MDPKQENEAFRSYPDSPSLSSDVDSPAPTPVEPTPVEPTPVEPTPVEPTPVEPTPVPPANPAFPTQHSPETPANPYAQPAPEAPANPYAQPAPEAPANPYAQPAPEAPANPYAQPAFYGAKPAKKSKKKKIIIGTIIGLLGAFLVFFVIVFLILYFSVIRPNSIISQARKNMENGYFDQAELLIMDMGNSEKVVDLRNEITYRRAAEAVLNEKYSEAKEYLNKIPNYEDTKGLRKKIRYHDATEAIESGDYETAYRYFKELGDYEDASEQMKRTYYEAIALNFILAYQPKLKNPSSLRVTTLEFHDNSSNSEGEICIVAEITGTNSYGGTVGSYVFDTNIYDAIKNDDLDPLGISLSDYNNPSDYTDRLAVLIIDGIRDKPKINVKIDIARINRLLEANVTFKVALDFSSDASVEV